MTVESLAWPADPPTPATEQRRPGRKPWRAWIGVGTSIAIHLALITLGLWSFSEQQLIVGDAPAGDAGGAITVTLMGPASLEAASGGQAAVPPPLKTSELDGLFHRLRPAETPGPPSQQPSPHQDASQLFKELAEAQSAKAEAKQGPEGSDDQAGNDLWPLVRPCWSSAGHAQVALDVQIDSAGRLTAAPTVVLEQAASAGRRDLLGESLAVQAAVRCAPYRTVAPGMGVKRFRVVFVPSSKAGRPDDRNMERR